MRCSPARGRRLTKTLRAPSPSTPPVLKSCVAARSRDALARVGLVVRLREVASWAEHVALTSRGYFEMALLGWQADTLDIAKLLHFKFSPEAQTWLWIGFFASFAVKMPMWPFHR